MCIRDRDTIMENFTSPAARSPYGGMKDGTQQIGLTIVIKVTISKPVSYTHLDVYKRQFDDRDC